MHVTKRNCDRSLLSAAALAGSASAGGVSRVRPRRTTASTAVRTLFQVGARAGSRARRSRRSHDVIARRRAPWSAGPRPGPPAARRPADAEACAGSVIPQPWATPGPGRRRSPASLVLRRRRQRRPSPRPATRAALTQGDGTIRRRACTAAGEVPGRRSSLVHPQRQRHGLHRRERVRPARSRLPDGALSRMIVLTANAIAKPTVQRFRLRSTSEPPPSGPWPVPTPKAPERPASLPECMSTRKIRTTEMATWMTEKSSSIGRGW